MTVGNEQRLSDTPKVDVKRRSSLGVRVSSANSTKNKNDNISTNTVEDSPKTASGKSPSRQTSRRGSTDSTSSNSSSSPRLKKAVRKLSLTSSTEDVSHNETVVLIHRDDDEPEMTSPDDSEPGSGSMFARTPKRRASEPAVGGHFLRAIQNNVSGVHTHNGDHASSGGGIHLKQIEEELPSDIVAEEEEEEEDRINKEIVNGRNENGNDNGELDKSLDKRDGQNLTKSSASSEMSLSSSSSSISSSKATNGGRSLPKEKEGNTKTLDGAGNGAKSRQQSRRKSEGDVLRFARIWRLHAGNTECFKELLEEKKEEPVKTSPTSKDDIWDAVRKCRYIRGHTPADMSTPSDLGEYVFGHHPRNPSTSASGKHT